MIVQFDPLTLEILWQRLVTIADETATVLARTAFSAVVAAANDSGCVIMDAAGRAIVHASRSLPLFNRTLPYATRAIIQKFGGDGLRPGDVFIANDPWLNAGHQPDVAVMTPFFEGDRLVGIVGTIVHVADVGGTLDSNNVREVYEEGLIIPMAHLYQEGRLNQLVLDFITANVRVPETVIGDIYAQVAANKTGSEKCLALMEEYELADLGSLADEILDRSEAAMRRAIQTIPDGEYRSRVYVDELDKRLHIECCIQVQGDELNVDFYGTSPQQPRGGINVTQTFTVGQASYALKCTLLPEVPGNRGCYRPIRITAPQGSVLNAQHPASVRQRHRVGAHIFGAVLAALAEVMPDRVTAGPGFLVTTVVFGKLKGGSPLFHAHNFCAGGMGASAGADGISTIMCPALAANVPVELFEVAVPLLVQEKEFLVDSGGPGRWRGGLGQRVSYRLLPGIDATTTVSIYAGGQHVSPFGLHGGRGGTPAEIMINEKVLTRDEKLTYTGALSIDNPDLVFSFDSAGGGGYGPPEERDVGQVMDDVRDGLISLKQAAQEYGVIIDPDTLAIDKAATETCRQRSRSASQGT
jgi:N-methylhydantoinase B/oxoprolinase/acetone carboxylase alpha subunit